MVARTILAILGPIMVVAGITIFVIMGDNLVLPLLGIVLIVIGIILLSIATRWDIRFLRKSK